MTPPRAAEGDWYRVSSEDSSEYAKALGARLRTIRVQQGLSLHGVEEKSRGRWKAVVIGSYERGDRAVTVQRLSDLAAFYGVPVAELLPEGAVTPTITSGMPRVVIDLEQLSRLSGEEATAPLARYAAAIQSQRGDYNGRVLSIRNEDLRSLAVLYDTSPESFTERLVRLGVVSADARRSIESAS
ncbi:MAG: transcriptional regulator BldD [Mycobacteriales bacterium]